MLLLLRFFRSSEVAIWSYPQGGRAMKAWCGFFIQEKRKFFVSNKELENENMLFQELFENDLVICKSVSFLMVKVHG